MPFQDWSVSSLWRQGFRDLLQHEEISYLSGVDSLTLNFKLVGRARTHSKELAQRSTVFTSRDDWLTGSFFSESSRNCPGTSSAFSSTSSVTVASTQPQNLDKDFGCDLIWHEQTFRPETSFKMQTIYDQSPELTKIQLWKLWYRYDDMGWKLWWCQFLHPEFLRTKRFGLWCWIRPRHGPW